MGQGALAIETRSDDFEVKALVEGLIHRDTDYMCRAERACLRVLEGGCSVPVGVSSKFQATNGSGGVLTLTGTVTSYDGEGHVENVLEADVESVEDAEALGEKVAKVLIDNGAKVILDDIAKTKEKKIEQANQVTANIGGDN